jgi:hypothetical protein
LQVGADHLGLHDDGALDDFTRCAGRPSGRALRVGLDDLEDAGSIDEAGLDDLGHPGDEVDLRQGRRGQVEITR